LYNSDFSFGKTIFWRKRFDYAEWCINGGFLTQQASRRKSS
jgi:hypothetical protein